MAQMIFKIENPIRATIVGALYTGAEHKEFYSYPAANQPPCLETGLAYHT